MKENSERLKKIISRFEEEIEKRDAQLHYLLSELNGMFSSLSWRVTAPLRKVHSVITGSRDSQFDPG